MERSVSETDANDHVSLELDLSTNGRFGPHRNLNSTPIVPKAEPEAERAPAPTQVEGGASSAERAPPVIGHLPPPPQVEGVSIVNSASTTRTEQGEKALRVAVEQMKSQRPPLPPCKRTATENLNLSCRGSNLIPPPPTHSNHQQMEGGNNAASRVPVLRHQQAVDAMNGRQLSAAGAGNVEAGRTKMPRVYARGGERSSTVVHGFLYRYDTVEALSIICVCHGLCHTPAQFVEHAGGGAAEREHPLRHIRVMDADDYLAHHLQTPSPPPSSSSHRRF